VRRTWDAVDGDPPSDGDSAKPRENLAFITGLLGMRLVKKTVNQDDVSAYHLFYADGKANPGTDLTSSTFRRLPSGAGPTASRVRACASPARKASVTADRLKQAGGVTGEVIEVRWPADLAV